VPWRNVTRNRRGGPGYTVRKTHKDMAPDPDTGSRSPKRGNMTIFRPMKWRAVAWLTALAASVWLMPAGTVLGHKFYASLAKVEHTADNRLEVSIRFFPDDLEKALRDGAAKPVAVEDTRQFASAFEPWFNSVFSLRAGKQVSQFKYLGVEISVHSVWVHLEAVWTTPLDRSSLRNTVLTDLFKDQRNTVNFVEGKKRSTIVFTRDKTTAEELIPPAPEADRR
jgi:hypothetical protein